MFSQFVVNGELQKTRKNLSKYVKVESWKYRENCHMVEPNKMLPNYEIK